MVVYFLLIQSFSCVGFVCVFLFYFLLVASESPHPGQYAVGARGWQRDCVWILLKGEVTSGFLCEDGQVHWCYCEGG